MALSEETEKRVAFTQYLMPDGRKREVSIPVPDEVFIKAGEILAAGLVFEIEMLSDYSTISMTITGKDLEGEERDLDCRHCRNGPKVPETVNAMILEFDLETRSRKL